MQIVNVNKQNKMRHFPTKIINLVGGPGTDKSLLSAVILLNLNLKGNLVEHIPDYAKSLVWQKDFSSLKNQYNIAQHQYKMLSLIDGEVQYIITEGSFPQILYYNEYYKENICDIQKTRKMILDCYNEFENINVFVEREDKKYQNVGRYQTEEEAKQIDKLMKQTLIKENLQYVSLKANLVDIKKFTDGLI